MALPARAEAGPPGNRSILFALIIVPIIVLILVDDDRDQDRVGREERRGRFACTSRCADAPSYTRIS
jgi:hypothetical protein